MEEVVEGSLSWIIWCKVDDGGEVVRRGVGEVRRRDEKEITLGV